jgi:hypothetical protein
MKKNIVLVHLVRVSTGTKMWASFNPESVGSLLKDGDCRDLERQIDADYPGWFVWKWALVPENEGKDLLCRGLEEVFTFESQF